MLYVGNLPETMDSAGLKLAFERLGAVIAEVARHKRRGEERSARYGFVQFNSEHDQQEAMSKMDGKHLASHEAEDVLKVEVAMGRDLLKGTVSETN